MVKYVGSKNKLAKHILPIILDGRTDCQWYIELFVGGCNLIDKVDGKRFGNDTNEYLIELFKAIQKGWEPPSSVLESQYQDIKTNKKDYSRALVGFVGFACSYSGKWFGGYARGNAKDGTARNYCLESKKNIMKQAASLVDVSLSCKDYRDVYVPDNSIVYCDPPYEGTVKYKDGINYDEFWGYMRLLSKNNTVYISEYNAPSDFDCVWSKEVNNTLARDTGSKKGIERLFKLRSECDG